MMLRSSSTPVLGSLLSSISPESPNNRHRHHDTTLHPYKSSPIHKFSFHQTLFCNSNSSPISQYEGNLGSLMSSSRGRNNINNNIDDAFGSFIPSKKLSSRLHCSLLETIPYSSCHNSSFKSNSDEEEHEDEEDGFCEFQGGGAGSGGGGHNFSRVGGGEQEGGSGGGDNHDMEEKYMKMVNESPGNPLLLGNYAWFLYQSKQDLQGAEEYYSRAIFMDPNDGEILSQYAKLLWELYQDKDQATSYFERAVRATSEDSHVHAAYASFLWETEEDEDIDDDNEGYFSNVPSLFNNGTITPAPTA